MNKAWLMHNQIANLNSDYIYPLATRIGEPVDKLEESFSKSFAISKKVVRTMSIPKIFSHEEIIHFDSFYSLADLESIVAYLSDELADGWSTISFSEALSGLARRMDCFPLAYNDYFGNSRHLIASQGHTVSDYFYSYMSFEDSLEHSIANDLDLSFFYMAPTYEVPRFHVVKVLENHDDYFIGVSNRGIKRFNKVGVYPLLNTLRRADHRTFPQTIFISLEKNSRFSDLHVTIEVMHRDSKLMGIS